MNIMMKRNTVVSILALLPLLFLSLSAKAQDTGEGSNVKKMSLEQVLKITEQDNFRVRMAEMDVEKVRSQYRQTNAVFLPSISLEETGISTNNPLNVFGSKLKQESVTQADFNPAILNAPDPYQNFTTKLQVQQPLLNTDMFFKRSAANSKLEATRKQLEGTVQHARYQVKDAYYQLLLMKDRMSVMERSLKTARENERQASNFLEQDMISKADYLAAKVRVLELESQYSKTEDQYHNVMENLQFLLGIKEDITIEPTDSLRMRPVALEQANLNGTNNSRLQALEYQMSAAKKMQRSAEMSFVPSLNLFGSYEFNDEVLFGTKGESYMIGATLKWDLFSGFKKVGKVMESRAAAKQAELAYDSNLFQHQLKIKEARRSLEQSRKQIKYASTSVEQASENYRIRKDRYEQGMEKTTDLLTAETKLAQARLQHLNALYQYNMSLATLELLLERKLVQ